MRKIYSKPGFLQKGLNKIIISKYQIQFYPDMFFFFGFGDFLFGDLEGEPANLLCLFGDTLPK